MRFCLVALLALIAAAASPAAAEGSTNAERFARGLPPLPPKFGRSHPGQARNPSSAFVPDRVNIVVSPSPSSKPHINQLFYKYAGRIKVVSYDGEPLGYLRNWQTGSVSGVNAGGVDTELHVTFKSVRSEDHLFNIYATNPNFPAPYYIGTSTTATLGPGLQSSVAFANVDQTPPKSPPVTVGNFSYESAIWSFDHKTNEITAHYVNPDGSTPKTTIAYNIWDNTIFFVGDIDAFNNATSDPDYLASPVTFFLENL
ncbi:hypothetical protein BJ138DRAFT_1155001 [Hygrophoropsis aurantiaca]|uniref:Uncharacterized protein n=1 Tax=Hygrophoropsis aurantiaca TaxID=72124 RepID=A0ACB8AA50_9AGAM|nr:hypothetical protein BJ138DRAFT_1155001 [Hygrophoropsis aurantiaca]